MTFHPYTSLESQVRVAVIAFKVRAAYKVRVVFQVAAPRNKAKAVSQTVSANRATPSKEMTNLADNKLKSKLMTDNMRIACSGRSPRVPTICKTATRTT